jgi:hypothetical protein
MEEGTDLPGYDMRRLSFHSAAECRDACAAEPTCLASTYLKNDVGDCFLKGTVPKRWPCDRCVSGVKGAGGTP